MIRQAAQMMLQSMMVLVDTSNSMCGSSGFPRTSDEVQEDTAHEGWDYTVLADKSPKKRSKTIEEFRNHPNLADFRKACAYPGPSTLATAAERAMGILQELCRLERVKPNADADICRIYSQNKNVFIKILLDDPASTPIDLTGKWRIEITQADLIEVSKMKAHLEKTRFPRISKLQNTNFPRRRRRGRISQKKIALPVGEYKLSLKQFENRLTGKVQDWNLEGKVEDQSANCILTNKRKKSVAFKAVISDDGMQLHGSWTGATMGSGEFVGRKAEFRRGLHKGPPARLVCPITRQLLEDPVLCADGHSYERRALEHWTCILCLNTSPVTGELFPRMAESMSKNDALHDEVEAWRLESLKSSGRPPFQIFVRTLTGKTIVINVDDETTLTEVKKKIMDKTSIPCDLQALMYAGKELKSDDAKLKDYHITKHSSLNLVISRVAPSSVSSCRPILFTMVDKRSRENMSFLAKPEDTIETVLLKYWCANFDERQPSKVTLWRDMEEAGDNYFTGVPMKNLSVKLGSLQLRRVHSDSDALYSGRLEMGITRRFVPMHLRQEYSRLECVKQFLHALVKRSQAYNYPNEMGLAVFGDTVEVVCEISPVLEDFREKIDKIDCDGDTSLLDALDRAAIKLEEWKRNKQQSLSNDLPLRLVVLSDGRDNRSSSSASEVLQRLQKNNIIVDVIRIGGERDENLQAIAKATGGYVFKPKSLSNLLQLCELASPERPPKSADQDKISELDESEVEDSEDDEREISDREDEYSEEDDESTE